MPGRGPAPKVNRVRERDDRRRQAEFRVLASDDVLRGPELPEGEIDWPPRTRDLWHSLRTCPMAATWLPVDWQSLLDVADLHRRFVAGEVKLAGEIRLRLSQYGVTPESRLRLRLMVDDAPTAMSKLEELRARQEARRLSPGSPRRRALLKAVNDANEQATPATNRKAQP